MKGLLFADYVRMIRGHKGVDWGVQLSDEDLPYLDGQIDPDGWYPMAVFERLGNAILGRIAGGDVQAARMWGRFSVDQLQAQFPELVASGDPVETLSRFKVLRGTFFDFEALSIQTLVDDHADILVHYHMGDPAEEAAAHQTMGFFERLLELAGATGVAADFASRSWAGDPHTLLRLSWG